MASDAPLAGAVMGIYAAQPVFSSTGEVLVNEGELIEVVTSDEQGRCETLVDYPFGGAFYVEELSAPSGYVRSEEKYMLGTDLVSDDAGKVTVHFRLPEAIVNEASRSKLTISKIAADTSLPI
ncbi:MAG: hypothetical protein II529_04030, partial [Erysipelotrichaceae bacterium]|nr:hypothetical protein [Erysipelotrichaceae bacterium]